MKTRDRGSVAVVLAMGGALVFMIVRLAACTTYVPYPAQAPPPAAAPSR